MVKAEDRNTYIVLMWANRKRLFYISMPEGTPIAADIRYQSSVFFSRVFPLSSELGLVLLATPLYIRGCDQQWHNSGVPVETQCPGHLHTRKNMLLDLICCAWSMYATSSPDSSCPLSSRQWLSVSGIVHLCVNMH